LLRTLFDRKDEKRTFTAEQRRIIWNAEEKRACAHCNESLTWEKFTIDHIVPHSRGGKTSLNQAQLMCRSCNSKKGARYKL
jgi:5-methylcytosine-specific restriction endonuclease McrA